MMLVEQARSADRLGRAEFEELVERLGRVEAAAV
jgi:hypothetical protein